MKYSQKGLEAYKAEIQKKGAPAGVDLPLDALLKTGAGKSKSSRAARFLLLLGKEEAGKILKTLSEDEVEKITAEIARTREIQRDEALEILQEFGQRLNFLGEGRGGVEQARMFLQTAFGREKAEEYIRRAVPESRPAPFAFMEDLSIPQSLRLLKDEPESSVAVVLSFLPPSRVSAYLKSCPPPFQVRIVRRLARLRKLNPEVLRAMERTLQEKAHRLGSRNEVEIDGKEKLTAILRHMDSSSENRILEDLKQSSPPLGEEIREQLHTMDRIFQMRSQDLERFLSDWDDRQIALILRGKEDRIKEHIFNHLSRGRKIMVEEELILSPPVPRRDVDKATKAFLLGIRQGEEEGKFILWKEDEELV